MWCKKYVPHDESGLKDLWMETPMGKENISVMGYLFNFWIMGDMFSENKEINHLLFMIWSYIITEGKNYNHYFWQFVFLLRIRNEVWIRKECFMTCLIKRGGKRHKFLCPLLIKIEIVHRETSIDLMAYKTVLINSSQMSSISPEMSTWNGFLCKEIRVEKFCSFH